MPDLPPLRVRTFSGQEAWVIDWRDHFRADLQYPAVGLGGEMRGFHVVFRLRIMKGGQLVFWDDDGCIIRLSGRVVHEDREIHPLKPHALEVAKGDVLEIAQWQFNGDWLWGASLEGADVSTQDGKHVLGAYLKRVVNCLGSPNGPPLKLFFGGKTPFRTVLSVYSMLLNGYRPSEVVVFGEHQWTPETREVFAEMLPFIRIVPRRDVLGLAEELGGTKLAELAEHQWFVFKLCVSVLSAPVEFGYMDDDVFVLSDVSDALAAFKEADLVFAPDWNLGEPYVACWGKTLGRSGQIPTARLNAGIYWLRNRLNTRKLATDMLRVPLDNHKFWIWEQGFMALQYADSKIHELLGQRFFYPIFDGLPGGLTGYDYAGNPCGFTTIHFGGLGYKPSDADGLRLADAILDRGARASHEVHSPATRKDVRGAGRDSASGRPNRIDPRRRS